MGDDQDDVEEDGLDISDSDSNLSDEEEHLIHASCTLKKDNTVTISSNVVNSQTQLGPEDPPITNEETDPDTSEDVKTERIELNGEECPTDKEDQENDLKLPLRP